VRSLGIQGEPISPELGAHLNFVVSDEDEELMRGGSLREKANRSSCNRKLRSAAPDSFTPGARQAPSRLAAKHMGGDPTRVGAGGENPLESTKTKVGSETGTTWYSGRCRASSQADAQRVARLLDIQGEPISPELNAHLNFVVPDEDKKLKRGSGLCEKVN
jgi:hypothetical protein